MIPLFVFYLHVVFVAWFFTRRWQREGLGEGILSVFFAGLIFFVGWSVSSFLVRLLTPDTEFFIDQDSSALLLLTVAEGFFYYFYLNSNGEEEEL